MPSYHIREPVEGSQTYIQHHVPLYSIVVSIKIDAMTRP